MAPYEAELMVCWFLEISFTLGGALGRSEKTEEF